MRGHWPRIRMEVELYAGIFKCFRTIGRADLLEHCCLPATRRLITKLSTFFNLAYSIYHFVEYIGAVLLIQQIKEIHHEYKAHHLGYYGSFAWRAEG